MNSSPRPALTVQQAVAAHPALAQVQTCMRINAVRLEILHLHLPPALRGKLRCGNPLDLRWVIWVPHAAAATKLRHLSPSLLKNLQERGEQVEALEFRVWNE